MVSDIEKTKTIKGKAEKHTEKLKELTELIDVAKDDIIIREFNIKITF
ncbi:MAG: hypothetical protein N2596_08625 [Syntrophorhabdaceae bacterium]|nr:hypothetical protein [Syntrophorhabdaceae bacterium]